MVDHRCCNLHSKFVLKRALLLSKRVKQQMVNIFNLLLGFIYFFGFILIILLIFTLVWSYRVQFLFEKGSNSIFEFAGHGEVIFSDMKEFLFVFFVLAQTKNSFECYFETLVVLIKPNIEFLCQILHLFRTH